MLVMGEISRKRMASDAVTTLTGRRITNLAIRDQRPSSFWTIPLLRTTPLLILLPKIASIAGSGMSAPTTASATTAAPA